MKGEIAKEQVRKYFVIFFFSFFCGILSDYFIINKYFFNKAALDISPERGMVKLTKYETQTVIKSL